jgi:hypothetical protein
MHVETLLRRLFMHNRRTFLALAAVAAAFSTPAFAVGSLVDLSLVDRNRGEPLQTYSHRGTTWVAGQPGSRYAVRLVNRSGERVMVVLSVDGVNAVTGETAAIHQTGYVLAPYQSTEITGWRKSMTEAAAFYFTSLPDSYAARTDRPDNVGVIGVAVFRERGREIGTREREFSRRSLDKAEQPTQAGRAGDAAPAAAPSAETAKSAGALREERLGTGHGEREYAPTSQTSFERDSERPAEVVRLRYDRYERLLASGIVRPYRAPFVPEPFPAFVPDPKG